MAEKQQLVGLAEALERAAPSAGVTSKRVFGCHALFRGEAMFSMVWKTGRIAVKIIEPDSYDRLRKLPGCEPWVAHAPMKNWVLLPEGVERDPGSLLDEWVGAAYAQAKSSSAARAKTAPARRGRRPTAPK